MAKRTTLINSENLETLVASHPYLLLFRKSDWYDYATLLAQIYDFIEEENSRIPYEVLRSLLIQHYSDRVENLDQKILQYVHIMIVELQVLRDPYDSLGNRYIEATRSGKDLLKLLESLVSERRRFSGTGADVLLSALNNLLLAGEDMSKAEAIRHHRDKIKAYQNDIKRIEENGVEAAELLPVHHSNEALFNQAEESAIHILAATEDVKSAIERERKLLVENHLQQKRTPGANIRTIAEFHLNLNKTEEFKSYNQAKELFSQLDGSQARHRYSDIARILSSLGKKEIIAPEILKRSHLSDFARHFSAADASIKDKTKIQIRILKQQVSYALTTNLRMAQENLNSIFRTLYEHKSDALTIIDKLQLEFTLPCVTEFGPIEPNSFHIYKESPEVILTSEDITVDEMRFLMQALLKSEEESVKKALHQLKEYLKSNGSVSLGSYPNLSSFVGLYALLEADVIDKEICKEARPPIDILLILATKHFVVKQVPDYVFTLKESHAL